jgi:hypothetical protein
MQVKFFVEIERIIVKMAMMQNSEVISSKFNAYRARTYEVNFFTKLN